MDTIRKFRLKFVFTTMLILLFVFLAIGASIIISMRIREERQSEGLLQRLDFPHTGTAESLPETEEQDHMYFQAEGINRGRIFVVMLDGEKNICAFIYDKGFFTEDGITETVQGILEQQKEEGNYNKTKFLIRKENDGMIVAAIDRTIENEIYVDMVKKVVVIGIVSLAVLFFIVLILSEWITKPIKVMLENQKQFVSDASHELKTPLTIISANTDVIVQENGESKWLKSIKAQTDRMNGLVKGLLSLAKTEELKRKPAAFDLSNAIVTSVLPFESLAYEKGKKLNLDIQDNIKYKGDEESVKTAVSILIDNAIKYSDSDGIINLTLSQEPSLTVYSSGCNMEEKDIEKIFDRFYRKDQSRNNGGYGLGLSILRKTAKNNKWKLQVKAQKDKFVSFTIHF